MKNYIILFCLLVTSASSFAQTACGYRTFRGIFTEDELDNIVIETDRHDTLEINSDAYILLSIDNWDCMYVTPPVEQFYFHFEIASFFIKTDSLINYLYCIEDSKDPYLRCDQNYSEKYYLIPFSVGSKPGTYSNMVIRPTQGINGSFSITLIDPLITAEKEVEPEKKAIKVEAYNLQGQLISGDTSSETLPKNASYILKTTYSDYSVEVEKVLIQD